MKKFLFRYKTLSNNHLCLQNVHVKTNAFKSLSQEDTSMVIAQKQRLKYQLNLRLTDH